MGEMLDNLPWFKKIEILRTAKGWSQEKAANECCTSAKTYWNWETGINYPRKLSRMSIARAFNVKETEIFGQEA